MSKYRDKNRLLINNQPYIIKRKQKDQQVLQNRQRIKEEISNLSINNQTSKKQMNPKSKQHNQFLSSLNYYDASSFIINSNQSPNSNFNNQQLIDSSFNDFFSMQYTKQFNLIQQFIQNQNQQLPLLIKSPINTGKKTLLSQIINHYHKHSPKTKLFIAHFSAVNHVYSQILYNIMVKLRIHFSINQKVQVNQQKIRRFFKYWLDLTSDYIQKNNLGYAKSQKQTLCIVIDGIDQLTNLRGQKVFPQFWLPQSVPKNVKLILSGTEGDLAIQKLQQQHKVKVISLTRRVLSQKIQSKIKPQIQPLLQKRQLSLFEIKTITWFLTNKQTLKISPQLSFHQIIQSYILACSSSSLSQNQIKSLLLCLSLSKKGLTQQQLRKIMKLKPQILLQFLYMFEPLINKYQNYYLITNSQIKKFIQQVYDPNKQKKQKYHQIIAKVIKRGQLSVRKLQQQIHHLIMAQNYFDIKQLITQIDNFLILYTPMCKYLLCNTWKILQIHLNSDPVFQYNKSIQSFLTHYHPKQEQLFKIIFQLSMFFREYSQFQGAKIPYFRHPLIRGDQEQLHQICVYDELKQHKMTTDLKVIVKKTVDVKGRNLQKSRLNENKQKQILSPRKQKTLVPTTISSQLQIQTRNSQASSSIQDSQIKNSDRIQQIQCLNLQIKQNRDKFKQNYLQILKPYLKQFYLPTKKLSNNDNFVKLSNNATQEDQDVDESNSDLFSQNLYLTTNKNNNSKEVLIQQLNKIKQLMVLKNLDQYFEENYHREETTKFYYYKEWMWIQFPWICQSLNYDFSQMIKQYIANPTQYMTMDTEIGLIKQVMKISQVSKQNKSAIFQNKPIQLISINKKKLKKNRRSTGRIQSIFKNSVQQKQNMKMLNNNRKTVNNSILNRQKSLQKDQSPIKKNINSNLAKFQLNLSKIDDKLISQLQKQMTNRCAYDSRILSKTRSKLNNIVNNNNNLNNQWSSMSPFLTQSINKQNSSSMLPKIQSSITKSRYVAQNSRSKITSSVSKINQIQQLQNQSSKRVRLVAQLNNMTNQNNQLKSIIQQVQKRSLMLDNIDQTTQLQTILKKQQELVLMRQKLHEKQQIQSKLKQKLQTIIKICDNNKSHQMQSQLLSTFLDNLKTMYDTQDKSQQTKMKQFIHNTQNNKNKIIQLTQYKNSLIKQIKNQYGATAKLFKRNNIEDQDNSLFSIPNHSSAKICLVKKDSKTNTKDKQQKVTISSKHESNHTKNIDHSRKRTNTRLPSKASPALKYSKSAIQKLNIWEQLSSIFQFDSSNYQKSVQNSHYLTEEFEQKFTKYKQLNFLYQELEYEKDSLDQKIDNLEQELKRVSQKNDVIIQGYKTNNKNQINQNQEFTIKIKKLNQIKKRNQILQQCLNKHNLNA